MRGFLGGRVGRVGQMAESFYKGHSHTALTIYLYFLLELVSCPTRPTLIAVFP